MLVSVYFYLPSKIDLRRILVLVIRVYSHACQRGVECYAPCCSLSPPCLLSSPPSARMPPPSDRDYTRRTICHAFAEGLCKRRNCPFSHTLIDPARLVRLVGDVTAASVNRATHVERIYLELEYKSYCLPGFSSGTWTITLRDGGRTAARGDGWSVELKPTYPVECSADFLLDALKDLEIRVYGRIVPVSSVLYRLSDVPDCIAYDHARRFGRKAIQRRRSARNSRRMNATMTRSARIVTNYLTSRVLRMSCSRAQKSRLSLYPPRSQARLSRPLTFTLQRRVSCGEPLTRTTKIASWSLSTRGSPSRWRCSFNICLLDLIPV